MDDVINPTVWAETGGLAGLVILALFGLVGIGLYSAKGIVQVFRDEMMKMLDAHARERKEWGAIIDQRQSETNKAIMAMTAAIHELSNRRRRYDDMDDHK